MTPVYEMVTPSDLWSAWTVDPLVLGGSLVAGWFYGAGVRRLPSAASGQRVISFYLALALIALSLFSPLDALGHAIFSAHMVQHLVLILVTAPLLVYGAPVTFVSIGLPASARRMLRRAERTRATQSAARVAKNPLIVLGLYVVVLWLWHLPSLYQAALRSSWVHGVEHATFLGTAVLFWALVIGGVRDRRRAGYGPALGLVFLNLLQSGALGIVLVFATTELYSVHVYGAAVWGITALEDQQLAGTLMYVPPGITYSVTMAVLFFRWMRSLDAGAVSEPLGRTDG
jgi:putative membrane protein